MKNQKSFPESLEVVYIAEANAICDGGGPVGHPRVFLTIDPNTQSVDCGYCDRRFVLDLGRAGTKSKATH
jgi:uncharacterized Zn-finger protein